MGKGLVNPIDDLRATNPPTNPDLLDALADAFVASGYDLKALLAADPQQQRVSAQRGGEPGQSGSTPRTSLTIWIKRLTAEQLLDAIN